MRSFNYYGSVAPFGARLLFVKVPGLKSQRNNYTERKTRGADS